MSYGHGTHLVEVKDTGQFWVQPYRIPFTFPEFSARSRCEERRGEALRLRRFGLAGAVNEIYASKNVSPLIRAANLHRASLGVVQAVEIVGLEQLVSEFGE